MNTSAAIGRAHAAHAAAILASLVLALALAAATAAASSPEAASATPPSDCRGQLCTATLEVGAIEGLWRSPQTFYPNNEDVYAAVHVGRRALSVVRSYGPGRCRHRFAAPGTAAVVKACGTGAPLVVRALRGKAGRARLWIDYVARPLIAGDAVAGSGTAIHAGLHRIAGPTGG